MKIVYVSNARIPTEKAHGVQIMSMCAAFASHDNEVELVVPRKKNFLGVDAFSYYNIKKNFSIRRIPIPDLGSMTSLFPRLLFVVDLLAFAIGLLFLHVKRGDVLYFRDFPLLFCFSRRRTLVLEVHHIFGWRWLFAFALQRVSVVVAITQGLKDDLVALGVPEKKIVVAPDAVDLELFEHVESKQKSRARLGLRNDEPIALYIGRFDSWKGTDTFFETSELLTGVHIVAIGGGVQPLEELEYHYPNISFISFRPYIEIANNQAAADVLVLPNSAREEISSKFTSPLKLFTYMASGIPIIAADLPSIREILSEDEAYFFEPDNASDLARVITLALADPDRAERAARARSKVTNHTWEERARHILAPLVH